MSLTVRLAAVHFDGEPAVSILGTTFGPAYHDGRDGTAVYVVEGEGHGLRTPTLAAQRFKKGPRFDDGGGVMWSWDGNRERPSLQPSFGWLMFDGAWTLHLFLKEGRVENQSDARVQVVR